MQTPLMCSMHWKSRKARAARFKKHAIERHTTYIRSNSDLLAVHQMESCKTNTFQVFITDPLLYSPLQQCLPLLLCQCQQAIGTWQAQSKDPSGACSQSPRCFYHSDCTAEYSARKPCGGTIISSAPAGGFYWYRRH